MAMRSWHPDHVLLGISLSLVLTGILVLAGVSAPFAIKNFGSSTAYLYHQLIFGVLPGFIAAAAFVLFRLESLRRLAPLFLLINIILMVMVFLPGTGVSLGGASRWVNFGPIAFQPSEFLKLTFIIYLASWLASRSEPRQKGSWNYINSLSAAQGVFLPFAVIIAFLSFILVLQPDVSTLGIIAASGLLMYFSAYTPFWHSAVFIALGVTALTILVKTAPYRANRLLVFFNPSIDPMGIGYQIKQALIAAGSGGIMGVGLGMGYNQLRLLPSAMSDTIFAAFAQETGFVGAILLITLFFAFVWRGLKIAKLQTDQFRRLLALGIVSWIGLQSFINMGAMIGIFPLAGIPLPFLSYGGSHVTAELMAVGLLLNISSRQGYK